ncbi:branched-chain amino acid ABC transporter substrate-binding protein [Ancylobacter sp. 6x-1]|uniref:Branched-chain amino acid ABC transporter substrate-binding protein n=1 Tax=Ancylobacter crimeensis TaxID=2579147 RepID=A0ABT0D8E0_9HYPH|nr:branched-chain amino acid ABC transporter substrate-binding protein [Ancylobacter crimeensis]MCK0196207.1 branched-chain amino acid ABC transporter substrate-binding protein [Ancylobacter crimeensis]
MKLKTVLLAAVAATALAGAARADVLIGTAGPTSNAEALFGTTWQNGMDLAVRQANAAGGVQGQKLQLVREDDGGDPKQGTLIAQKQCDNKEMLAVVANFNSGVTIPSSDVYNRCGLPQVTNASNPKVTKAGYKNLFRPIANDLAQGAAPAEYALEKLHAKTAAVVHDKQAFGQGVAEVFRDTFTKGGGKVTSFSGVAQTDVDFSALLTTIRSENPDVIYFGGVMPAVGLFVKQAREFGLKGTFFGADSAFTPDFIQGAGAASAGAIVSFQAPPYDSSDALKTFAADYKKAFGEEPGPYSAYGYVEASIIIEAMKKAPLPLTREGIVAEIAKSDFESVVGHVAFQPNGELKQPFIFLYQVKDNGFSLVK